jgi:hypothetical protein
VVQAEEAGSKRNLQRTARRYITEDRILHNRRYENLKSYTDLGRLKTSIDVKGEFESRKV